MKYEELLESVENIGGFASRGHAAVALHAVVTALGEFLAPEDLSALGDEVPALEPALATVRTTTRRDLALDDFYASVSEHTSLSAGRAMECAQAVTESLARVMSEGLHSRIVHHLPDDWAPLFEVRDRRSHHRDAASEPQRSRTTLAEGRPGSRHPLSEAKPHGAHTESVAESDNPHEATKVSSSRGLTQERRDHSLATGQPPRPDRTLGEA